MRHSAISHAERCVSPPFRREDKGGHPSRTLSSPLRERKPTKTSTTLTRPAPTSGYRTEPDWASLHDIDYARHEIVVDYRIKIDAYNTDFAPGAFAESWARTCWRG